MKISIDEAIKKYKDDAVWEHCHNNMDYYEEYKQIAEWLEKLQKIEEILDNWENSGEEDDPINIIDNIEEVIEDGKMD